MNEREAVDGREAVDAHEAAHPRVAYRHLAPGDALAAAEPGIAGLLTRVDREFVPPLSSRDSTTTKALGGADAGESTGGGEDAGGGGDAGSRTPVVYLAAVLEQHAILAEAEGGVVGLLSYRPGHTEPLLESWSPCDYVSTIAVLPSWRRRGIARRLYQELFGRPGPRSPYVATRTWSGNDSHLRLLDELGFTLVADLPDHRGPGIATRYYARPSGA